MNNPLFHFSKAERIGIIVLLSLCVLLFVLPRFFPSSSQQHPTDFTPLMEQLEAWEKEEGNDQASTSSSEDKATLLPTSFDPNKAKQKELQAVGLSTKSTRAWLSYLSKGGTFDNWRDIEQFRALSAEERSSLKPFLTFANTPESEASDPTQDFVPEMVPFDPNEVSKNQLMAMGVPDKTATNWTRFLASGGRFRQAQEIQKIYGLSEEVFQRLLPYAAIPSPAATATTTDAESYPTDYESSASTVIIDINQATVADWQQLRGIGPAFSKRIVNFRDKLGGFEDVQQVSETYGLPDSVFQKIYLQLRPSPIFRPLKINTATVEELAAHPYLRFNDARMIVNYRTEHGTYASIADLDKLYGLEEKTKNKITPYLSFE